jgi:hypothetical protein
MADSKETSEREEKTFTMAGTFENITCCGSFALYHILGIISLPLLMWELWLKWIRKMPGVWNHIYTCPGVREDARTLIETRSNSRVLSFLQ